MDSPIIGGVLAFVFGTAVAVLNYCINLRTLKKNPSAISTMSVVRQILNIACLAAAFLLSRILPWDAVPLLIGAAAGLTIPSFALAVKLAKINDSLQAPPEEEDASGEKGDETHE